MCCTGNQDTLPVGRDSPQMAWFDWRTFSDIIWGCFPACREAFFFRTCAFDAKSHGKLTRGSVVCAGFFICTESSSFRFSSVTLAMLTSEAERDSFLLWTNTDDRSVARFCRLITKKEKKHPHCEALPSCWETYERLFLFLADETIVLRIVWCSGDDIVKLLHNMFKILSEVQ